MSEVIDRMKAVEWFRVNHAAADQLKALGAKTQDVLNWVREEVYPKVLLRMAGEEPHHPPAWGQSARTLRARAEREAWEERRKAASRRVMQFRKKAEEHVSAEFRRTHNLSMGVYTQLQRIMGEAFAWRPPDRTDAMVRDWALRELVGAEGGTKIVMFNDRSGGNRLFVIQLLSHEAAKRRKLLPS